MTENVRSLRPCMHTLQCECVCFLEKVFSTVMCCGTQVSHESIFLSVSEEKSVQPQLPKSLHIRPRMWRREGRCFLPGVAFPEEYLWKSLRRHRGWGGGSGGFEWWLPPDTSIVSLSSVSQGPEAWVQTDQDQVLFESCK